LYPSLPGVHRFLKSIRVLKVPVKRLPLEEYISNLGNPYSSKAQQLRVVWITEEKIIELRASWSHPSSKVLPSLERPFSIRRN
jgi:hypothetical protein